jgi:predicted O-linked N-acetylglucosamine transferase (SPINDLY family)
MAGVPVITTKGIRNAENMGASICTAANMSETICSSVDEYVNKAVELTSDQKKIVELKTKLKVEGKYLPLFNVRQFVFDLELKLKEIVK